MFIPVNGGQGISRPFVVGLILLLVFLGMQSDFVPSRPADSSTSEEATVPAKDSAKERIILELSKSNEKLEKELLQLQQHLLLVKHAAHQHGVEHSSRLGSMLYNDGILTHSNGTDVEVASQQGVTESASVEVVHNTSDGEEDVGQVKNASRRELPQHSHRTHHLAQQTASSP